MLPGAYVLEVMQDGSDVKNLFQSKPVFYFVTKRENGTVSCKVEAPDNSDGALHFK